MERFSVKKPFTVLVAAIIIIAMGVVSLMNLQMDLLPEISLPYVIIITAYPGASPEKVEDQLTKPLENALGTISGVENVMSTSAENYSMVQLEFAFTGYGEASMPPYLGQTVESVTAFLSRVDLGQFNDPFQLDTILAYIDSLSPEDGAAKAAIDIALHDLVGKLLGQPWWRLWGLDPSKTPNTTFTIGIDTPEVVREKTRECADKFKILKVKVGLDNDKEMINTIREITDLPLAVDANQGWKDREQALDEIFWLKENGIVMVEQPMAKERLEDNAWITERSPLPIFADESIQRLADIPAIKGAYHGINIKLMKCTGMREAWKMAHDHFDFRISQHFLHAAAL